MNNYYGIRVEDSGPRCASLVISDNNNDDIVDFTALWYEFDVYDKIRDTVIEYYEKGLIHVSDYEWLEDTLDEMKDLTNI